MFIWLLMVLPAEHRYRICQPFWLFQGPEIKPFYILRLLEKQMNLFGAFRPLKMPYLGVNQVPESQAYWRYQAPQFTKNCFLPALKLTYLAL